MLKWKLEYWRIIWDYLLIDSFRLKLNTETHLDKTNMFQLNTGSDYANLQIKN